MKEPNLFEEEMPVTDDGDEFRFNREFDRLRGLLRFAPEVCEDGVTRYVARCAPDYFVLPLLAEHFAARFGNTAWAIIDERRGMTAKGGSAEKQANGETGNCNWEQLWRDYHRIISIEERKNPKLQKQFIPERYRKYLTEII
jgi:probable DNA metabolism protein